MQIIHRISISSTPTIRRELAALGIVVADRGFISFEIDEANELWHALEPWIVRRMAVDFVTAKFSERELAGSKWLELIPDWHHGYPQPSEDEFGYREVTYDLTEYCAKCGVGMKQKASFQMKAEPKWGRNGILQLNWVLDEYFVTPEVWTTIFKPNGIDCRPVMKQRGVELKTVVQLVVDNEVGILTDGLPSERCSRCGRVKYLPVTRGPFPALAAEPLRAMVKTSEYFGSGAAADERVVVSRKLAGALAAEKVFGASVRPVASL
jgi:hypothetical protein